MNINIHLLIVSAMVNLFCPIYCQNATFIDVQFPKECVGLDICDVKPKNYTILLNSLRDRIHSNMKYVYPEGIVLKTYDHDKSGCDSCLEIKQTMTPFMLRTTDKVNKKTRDLVIIQNEFVHQTIQITKCLMERSPCFRQLVPGDMENTACITEYTRINLYVYDQENEEPRIVNFDIPISCSCNIFGNFYCTQDL